jgi:hypothetical protein
LGKGSHCSFAQSSKTMVVVVTRSYSVLPSVLCGEGLTCRTLTAAIARRPTCLLKGNYCGDELDIEVAQNHQLISCI